MGPITAKLSRTADGQALAVVDGLPGGGAELRPGQLRDLAAALIRLADAAEGRKLMHRGKPLPDMRWVYPGRS